jgi:hypothetical protein
MFSPDFNQVYREAFSSATGRDFDDDDVQADYRREAEATVEALLERWTDPEFDPSPITDFKESRGSQTFRIKHPETRNFTEEDAADIARIRFLGQQALIAAQLYLLGNPGINPDDPDRFDSLKWAKAHPDQEFDQSFAYHPDTASPQRLLEWPEGEYINCLGIAIASAAESENRDEEYVFMNRIRSASYEASTHAVQFLLRLKQICPDALGLDAALREFESAFVESTGGDDNTVKDIRKSILDRDVLDYIFAHARELDTAFHHAVICKNTDTNEPDSAWRQFDPYGLIFSDITPELLDKTLSDDVLLHNPGACNELLFLDGDVQEFASRNMAHAIDIATRSKKRLKKLLGDYHSPLVMDKVRVELEKTRQVIYAGLSSAREPLNNLSDELIFENEQTGNASNDLIWISILGWATLQDTEAYASYRQAYTDFVKKSRGMAIPEGGLLRGLAEALSRNVFSSLKNKSRLQENFERTILAAPFVDALRFAESQIERSVYDGESEKAMEVGDPAFQIGSMYLNHYARWRKDGIVNVAKELTRINPSQLIWQSAISQEGGVASDDRVAAVGTLVKSLKRGQKHPLVNLTQHKE